MLAVTVVGARDARVGVGSSWLCLLVKELHKLEVQLQRCSPLSQMPEPPDSMNTETFRDAPSVE